VSTATPGQADEPRVNVVESPNKPRPDDHLARSVADTLRRIENNYHREGSGPGSRFEGELLEDVQARTAIATVTSWQRELAAREPHAAPEPVQLLLGPCKAQGHHGEHLQLQTHDHWLCAITLTNMLVAADMIADPAPDVTKLRAELDEEQGYRSDLTNDILLNAPESFDGDEAADVIAVRYVRHLEAEIAEHAEAKPAPELAAAMRETRELRELVDEATSAALARARQFLPAPLVKQLRSIRERAGLPS
jgi:hypothetical protein